MSDLSLNNIESLVQSWLDAEENGNPFPVPFDIAWQIAGYSNKANAKRGLKGLKREKHFSSVLMKTPSGGRSTEIIQLSCDAFKHFCLMAETDRGEEVRDYFIEAEKKWRLVQKHHPAIAEDVEMKRLEQAIRFEELRYMNTKIACDLATMHGKQYALVALGRDDAIVEVDRTVLEVIDTRCGDRRKGMTTKQLADYVKGKTGIRFKSGAEVERQLQKHAPELLDLVQRPVNQVFINEENIDRAVEVLSRGNRQLLLGE